MNIIFNKCSDAINHSLSGGKYGIFYSKNSVADTSIHVHDCCEVLFCISGGDTFLIDDSIFSVNDGDIFIINQFEPHKITFKKNEVFERYVIQLHPSFIYDSSSEITDLSHCFYARTTPDCNRLSLTEEDRDYVLSLIERLKSYNSFGDDILKNNIMTEIMIFINKKFIESSQKAPSDLSDSRVVLDAIKYINLHYGEDIYLADIAENSYISINQLCLIFKKCLGTTVIKYLTSKRISEAKKLLKNGKSITETSAECGFNDYANFIRTFTKTVGVSPKKYASGQ